MNIATRTRGILAATLLLVGLFSNLGNAQTVNVNGAACAAATVTIGAGTININTAGCSGTVSSPPSISSLSVTSGVAGAPVTINGNNFSGATITIGGANAAIINNSGTQITTTVPLTATVGAGLVVVTTAVAPAASTAFTVSSPPTIPPAISSLSVASGAPGSALTIIGTNLSGASVTIGGTAAFVTSNNGTQIATTVPANATVGAGNVVVTTAVNPPASSSFTVLAPPPPTISSVAPASGQAGTIVTIAGSGFVGASVTIGGAAATITSSSGSSITTTVPQGATVGAGNVVVTTAVSPSATFPFTVAVGVPVEQSIEGTVLPNPSKQGFIIPSFHSGLNGAGSEVNAYAMNPTRCSTVPALTRSWQHNIDLADYQGKHAFDFFILQANEALSYKFTVGNIDASGGFIYNDAANAVVRPTFISITSMPCSFDTAKLVVGANRDACYQTGLNGNSVNWANITGPLPAAYCRLNKNAVYYLNIRFQDGRPASQGGSPTTDSCTSGNCGGIIQAL